MSSDEYLKYKPEGASVQLRQLALHNFICNPPGLMKNNVDGKQTPFPIDYPDRKIFRNSSLSLNSNAFLHVQLLTQNHKILWKLVGRSFCQAQHCKCIFGSSPFYFVLLLRFWHAPTDCSRSSVHASNVGAISLGLTNFNQRSAQVHNLPSSSTRGLKSFSDPNWVSVLPQFLELRCTSSLSRFSPRVA